MPQQMYLCRGKREVVPPAAPAAVLVRPALPPCLPAVLLSRPACCSCCPRLPAARSCRLPVLSILGCSPLRTQNCVFTPRLLPAESVKRLPSSLPPAPAVSIHRPYVCICQHLGGPCAPSQPARTVYPESRYTDNKERCPESRHPDERRLFRFGTPLPFGREESNLLPLI